MVLVHLRLLSALSISQTITEDDEFQNLLLSEDEGSEDDDGDRDRGKSKRK